MEFASQPVHDDPADIPASWRPHNRFLKRRLESLDEAPSTPAPSLTIIPQINRLAYKVKPESIKTLRLMMHDQDQNWVTKLIHADGAVGLLMTFDDYKSVAEFYEWTTKNSFVRQLSVSIQLRCGESSQILSQAQEFMNQLAADRKVTATEVEIKIEDDAAVPIKNFPHFYYLLKNGVFCEHCLISHVSVIPDEGF